MSAVPARQGVALAGSMPVRIGSYRIVERIGRGAMGVVYSARDERTSRPVAVKVMMGDLEADPETRERFSREARVAGRLLHRNIITVYEMGEEDGRLFMVMELLEGETLAEYLRRHARLGLEQALDLMTQVCEGLAVAHAHGIVHRDVKPGNLFVQRDGGLKILDFGVARLANSSMTASGFIVGTPDFMSPEQSRGVREIDQRSDVFSAGAVFYYMLSGRKPFAAADMPAVLHKVNAEDPPPLTPDEAPPGLWAILRRALAKSVDDRPGDMGELLADLVRFQREYDRESKALARAAAADVNSVIRLLNELRRLDPSSVRADTSPFSDALLDRYPVLEDRRGDALGVVPFRRSAILEIREDLRRRREALEARLGRLREMRAAT